MDSQFDVDAEAGVEDATIKGNPEETGETAGVSTPVKASPAGSNHSTPQASPPEKMDNAEVDLVPEERRTSWDIYVYLRGGSRIRLIQGRKNPRVEDFVSGPAPPKLTHAFLVWKTPLEGVMCEMCPGTGNQFAPIKGLVDSAKGLRFAPLTSGNMSVVDMEKKIKHIQPELSYWPALTESGILVCHVQENYVRRRLEKLGRVTLIFRLQEEHTFDPLNPTLGETSFTDSEVVEWLHHFLVEPVIGEMISNDDRAALKALALALATEWDIPVDKNIYYKGPKSLQMMNDILRMLDTVVAAIDKASRFILNSSMNIYEDAGRLLAGEAAAGTDSASYDVVYTLSLAVRKNQELADALKYMAKSADQMRTNIPDIWAAFNTLVGIDDNPSEANVRKLQEVVDGIAIPLASCPPFTTEEFQFALIRKIEIHTDKVIIITNASKPKDGQEKLLGLYCDLVSQVWKCLPLVRLGKHLPSQLIQIQDLKQSLTTKKQAADRQTLIEECAKNLERNVDALNKSLEHVQPSHLELAEREKITNIFRALAHRPEVLTMKSTDQNKFTLALQTFSRFVPSTQKKSAGVVYDLWIDCCSAHAEIDESCRMLAERTCAALHDEILDKFLTMGQGLDRFSQKIAAHLRKGQLEEYQQFCNKVYEVDANVKKAASFIFYFVVEQKTKETNNVVKGSKNTLKADGSYSKWIKDKAEASDLRSLLLLAQESLMQISIEAIREDKDRLVKLQGQVAEIGGMCKKIFFTWKLEWEEQLKLLMALEIEHDILKAFVEHDDKEQAKTQVKLRAVQTQLKAAKLEPTDLLTPLVAPFQEGLKMRVYLKAMVWKDKQIQG